MNIIFITQKLEDKNQIQNFIISIYNFLKKNNSIKVLINDSNSKFKNSDFIFLGKRSKYLNFLAKFIKTLYLYLNIYKTNKKNKIDIIYVHQIGIFIALLFPLKFLFNFKLYFWRAHTHHSFITYIYYLCSDKIFTTNKKTLKNNFLIKHKIYHIGQMVEYEIFNIKKQKFKTNKFLYIGRITKIKNIHKMIEFINFYNLKNNNKIYLDIYGPKSYVSQDISYFEYIKKFILDNHLSNYVKFKGLIERKNFDYQLKDYFGYFNFSDGAIDKSVLESALCGVIIFSDNIPFNYEFKKFGPLTFNNFHDLMNNINYIYQMKDNEIKNLILNISSYIRINHSLDTNYLKTFLLH